MGTPRLPDPVKYFITCLSAEKELLEQIGASLEDGFGAPDEFSAPIPWRYSPAYTRELGKHIRRRFFVCRTLRRPEELPSLKFATMELEHCFCRSDRGETARRVNLDPGYVSGSHVILASTKRYRNRVHLRDGIYADLTLYYDGRTFQRFGLPTLPDYRTRGAIAFFNGLRRRYRRQLAEELGASAASIAAGYIDERVRAD